MKSFKLILMTISISVAMFSANAEEKNKKAAKTGNTAKELSVKGTIMCGKCTLKKTDVCQAALQVKRKGKDGKKVTRVVLLKNDAVTMAFHKKNLWWQQNRRCSDRQVRRRRQKTFADC